VPGSKDIQYSIARPGSPQTKNHGTALLRTPKGADNRKKSQPYKLAVTFLFAMLPEKIALWSGQIPMPNRPLGAGFFYV
jgi:hypothetical protein